MNHQVSRRALAASHDCVGPQAHGPRKARLRIRLGFSLFFSVLEPYALASRRSRSANFVYGRLPRRGCLRLAAWHLIRAVPRDVFSFTFRHDEIIPESLSQGA